QLGEELGTDAPEAIEDDERHRHDDQRRLPGREGVDRAFIKERHIDVDQLRHDEEGERYEDPPPQVPVARPEVGEEAAHGREFLAEADFGRLVADGRSGAGAFHEGSTSPMPGSEAARGRRSAKITTSSMKAAPTM